MRSARVPKLKRREREVESRSGMYMCRLRGERSIASVSCYMEERARRVARGLYSALEVEGPESGRRPTFGLRGWQAVRTPSTGVRH